LAIHVLFRHITGCDQSINAWLRQLGAIAAKAHIEKLASDAVLTAKVMIVPLTILLDSGRYRHRLRMRSSAEAKNCRNTANHL
jgi:hypothetical protein